MALSPEIRKRLQELNRGPLTFHRKIESNDKDTDDQNTEYKGAKERPENAAEKRRHEAQPVLIENEVPGEIISNTFGAGYLINKTYSEMVPDSPDFIRRFSRMFDSGAAAWRQSELHCELKPMLDVDPRQVLYLDIETTGLSSTPVFLVGLMHYTGVDFHLRQFFARDYSEEAAILGAVAEAMQDFEVLVTYNGKSFDAPFIRDRAVANGLEVEFRGRHLDLLHEARRRWRGIFPNCRLQTLEERICKRLRVGDIPGELIPQAYHDFVRTGNARQMCDVLHHNALDLIAMAEILLFMIGGEE